MNTNILKTIYAGALELIQNEILHPARIEDFRYCYRVWREIFQVTVEFLTPIAQLAFEVGCEIIWFAVIEAINLTEEVADWIQYWWTHHREPQIAAVKAWTKAQEPKLQAFLNWLAACYVWILETPAENGQLVVEEQFLLTAVEPVLMLTSPAEEVVPVATDSGVIELGAIAIEAVRSSEDLSNVGAETTVAPVMLEEQEIALTADALKEMQLAKLRQVAPSLGVAGASSMSKKRLLPLLLEKVALQTA